MSMGPPVLSVHGLTKRYAAATVLDDVSLDVGPGTVHALVGANGAGKSTLIKLVSGLAAPTAGTITLDGDTVSALTPRLARERGVFLVPQERHVCPDLTVAENVLLGRVPTRLGVVRRRALLERAREALDEVGLTTLDARTRVRDLTVAQMQLVEVARALSARARVVIMDEPTAALGPDEVAALFAVVRRLQARGVAFIYVSHHLEEIFELADEVTVLRDGRHVTTQPRSVLDLDGLITLLLGRTLAEATPRRMAVDVGDVALDVRGLRRGRELDDVSLRLHQGEVLVVCGGIGSGRAQLVRALVGALPVDAGSVTRPGAGPVRSPAEAVRRGIAFLPEDRKQEGILAERDLVDNVDLGWLAASGRRVDAPGRRRRAAGRQVVDLGVKTAGVRQPIARLSGGNQQKVLLGRWFGAGTGVLVLEGPTAGVDLGSREEIHRALRRFAADGGAVVISTSDPAEARQVGDRALVMRRGRIAGQLKGNDITEERLMGLEYGTAPTEAAAA
jgi:ribose transport system ATP-binding protein